ncbi:hypothetical protein PCE1_001395 [Barthelona sp. PCE]
MSHAKHRYDDMMISILHELQKDIDILIQKTPEPQYFEHNSNEFSSFINEAGLLAEKMHLFQAVVRTRSLFPISNNEQQTPFSYPKPPAFEFDKSSSRPAYDRSASRPIYDNASNATYSTHSNPPVAQPVNPDVEESFSTYISDPAINASPNKDIYYVCQIEMQNLLNNDPFKNFYDLASNVEHVQPSYWQKLMEYCQALGLPNPTTKYAQLGPVGFRLELSHPNMKFRVYAIARTKKLAKKLGAWILYEQKHRFAGFQL